MFYKNKEFLFHTIVFVEPYIFGYEVTPKPSAPQCTPCRRLLPDGSEECHPKGIYKLRLLYKLSVTIVSLIDDPPDAGIHLQHNELTDFPASLCLGPWQKSLKIINLSDNKLEGCALPLQLGLLCGLVRLVLDTNGLTALPPSIGNLWSQPGSGRSCGGGEIRHQGDNVKKEFD
jgi:hypothetical protein